MSDYSQTPIIELAAIIAAHLRDHNIKVVLVGGLAVEIYSENLYLTKDIDMVDISYTPPKALKQAMRYHSWRDDRARWYEERMLSIYGSLLHSWSYEDDIKRKGFL